MNYEFILFLHREFFTLSSKAQKAGSPICQLVGRFSSLRATLLFYVPFHCSLFMPLCHVFSQFLGVDSFPFFRIPFPGLLSSQSLVSLLFRLLLIFPFSLFNLNEINWSSAGWPPCEISLAPRKYDIAKAMGMKRKWLGNFPALSGSILWKFPVLLS